MSTTSRVLFSFLCILTFSLARSAAAEDWIYSVRPGDTLWGLCFEYTNVSNCWQRIGPYNNVDYPRNLAPGTRIRFPAEWLKAQPVPAEIVYIRGDVDIVLKGDSDSTGRGANLGDKLTLGSTVETGEDSSVSIRFADGAIFVLEANGKILLDTLSQHGETGMVDSRINLVRGKSRSTVPEREPASAFSVVTPSAVAAVRGTEFSIQSDGTNAEVMLGAVYDGEIAVKQTEDQKGAVQIPGGFGIRAEQGKPLGEPIELLAAPLFDVIDAAEFSPLEVSWQAVENAEAYRLEVLTASKDDELLEVMGVTTVKVELNLAPSVCYRLRLSAIDRHALPGMPGEQAVCVGRNLGVPTVNLEKGEAKDTINIDWSETEGALAYYLEISTTPDFSELVYEQLINENQLTYSPGKRGEYFVRVRAVGDFEMPGKYSKVQSYELRGNSLWEALGFILFAVVLTL